VRSRARGIDDLWASVRRTEMAWRVSDTVDECPSGRESSGRRATGGCKRLLGDQRSRAVEQHVVGEAAQLARAATTAGTVDRETGYCGDTLQRRSRARKAVVACLHTASAEWSEDPKVGPA